MKICENDLNSNPDQNRSKDFILQEVKSVRKGGFTITKRSTIVQAKSVADFACTLSREVEVYKANAKNARRQVVERMLNAFA